MECVEDLMEKVFEGVRKDYARKGEKKERFKPKFLNDEKSLV